MLSSCGSALCQPGPPAMKKPSVSSQAGKRRTTRQSSENAGKIHPVIIYPFKQPGDYSDLEGLYGLVAQFKGEKEKYAPSLTVMDRKTYYAMEMDKSFTKFRKDVVGQHSEILDAWCVDTCQMWYVGLG